MTDSKTIEIPTPYHHELQDPYYKSELLMLKIMCSIKNKINWSIKIKNSKIRKKWFKEIKEQNKENKTQLTEAMLTHIKEELFFLAFLVDKNTLIHPSGIMLTYHVDNFVDELTKLDLVKYINYMEQTEKNDWHPTISSLNDSKKIHGQNYEEKVLDIVHPSLYPKLIKQIISKKPKKHDKDLSQKYCWIPSELYVNDKGETKIMSYINNLHPDKHSKL